MKSIQTLLVTLVLLIASAGRAQVVLPSSSNYHDPYNYFRDCIDRNGEEHEGLCEQQTSSLFPEEGEVIEPEVSEENPDDYALVENY
jgi:hypothetical protein